MQKLKSWTFLLALSLTAGLAANQIEAASVQVDIAGTRATGITSMNIDGTDYDVVFDDLLSGTDAINAGYVAWRGIATFGDQSLATSVTSEIAGLFSDAGVVGIRDVNGDINPAPYTNHGVALFYGQTNPGALCFEPGADAAAVAITQGTSGSWGQLTDDCVPLDSSLWAGAYFKESVVPIPAAVWLFGSALAGLGWLRRRAAQ